MYMYICLKAKARAHVQAQVHNESINPRAMTYTEAQTEARSHDTSLCLDHGLSVDGFIMDLA